MKLIKNKKYHLIFLFIFFVLIKCANQLPPSGGEVDRIPPKITKVYPEDGTVNYNEDYFEIEFSEYVDKRSVTDAIFISPFIEGSLEYSWSATTLEVDFPEKLKKDVTYTITIGTDVVDLNNKNRMAEAFTFSFSTGSKIDKKIISGRVYGKEKEGIFIYAYKIVQESDTLLKTKPDYVSQTGVGGSFSLRGLGEGRYRVFAVNDQYRDYLYQQDQDEIGISYKDVYFNEEDSIFTDLDYMLFSADTSKPRLINAIMTDKDHLLVSANKELDLKSISANNFYLIDSTDNKEYKIVYAFKGKTKPEEFILMLHENINPEDLVYLYADTLVDKKGNTMVNDFTKVLLSDRQDTSSIKIVSTEPGQGKTVDYMNTKIKVYFDEAFNKNLINSAISLTDTFKKPIDFKFGFDDDATLVIKPTETLKQDKDYLLQLQLGKFVDLAGNNRDSVFTLKFKTISGLDFTGLSGFIINLDFDKHPILVLQSSENEELNYSRTITSNDFEFTRVIPGKYLLWCYLDENNNGEYDYGWPEPIKYSERFSFYPDTLNLRPRWEVTDLKFKFK
ncbi:MAG: Ig-like domain-containing protein [Ignavibacteriaceae bacterium]